MRTRSEAAKPTDELGWSDDAPIPRESNVSKPENVSPRARRKKAKPTPEAAEEKAEELFTTAPGQEERIEIPEVGGGFGKIVDKVFDLPNPHERFDELVAALSIDDALTPGVLQAALNRAEDNARLAHQLYVCSKADHERFEIENERVVGAMREKATAELQVEKDAGARSKAITKDDVTARVATMFPDEWAEVNSRKVKAKGMLDHLQRIADIWTQRCRSLSAMLHAGKQ